MRTRVPLLGALLAVLALLVATLPSKISPVDGGELSAVAKVLGVPHPTGYPLWTPIARLAAAVPAGPTLPWRLALLSALAGAAALALVAPLLENRAGPGAGGLVPRLLAPAFLLLGSSLPAFLAAARTAEVYALALLLLALLARLAHEAGEGRVPADRAVLLGAYVVGLGSGGHMTLLLAAPAFLLLGLLATRRRETWALAIVLAALGRTVYAFLPIRSACDPPFDWGNPETWRAFTAHTLAWQYRVWMFSSLETARDNLATFARDAWRGFSLLLALVPLGAARLWRRAPRALAASALLALLVLAYGAGYSIHDIAIYFLPAHLVLLYWIAQGAWEAAERLGGRAGHAQPLAVLVAAALLAAALGWASRAGRERAEAEVAEGYARSLLASLPPRAVLLSRFWDLLVSPAIGLQTVEGFRADVTVIDQEHMRRSWHVPLLERTAPDLALPARAESEAFLRLLAPFEAGEAFDAARIQAAYERLVFRILNADTTRPIFATIDVEPALVAPYRSQPWGLAMRLVRAGGAPAPLFDGPLPAWRPRLLATAGETGRMAADVLGEMAAVNAEWALAVGDTALARRRLAEGEALGRGEVPRARLLRARLR